MHAGLCSIPIIIFDIFSRQSTAASHRHTEGAEAVPDASAQPEHAVLDQHDGHISKDRSYSRVEDLQGHTRYQEDEGGTTDGQSHGLGALHGDNETVYGQQLCGSGECRETEHDYAHAGGMGL